MNQFIKTKYIYLILILGLVLRLIVLNQSLWLDEAIGALVVKEQNYQQILTQFPKSDNHPPLYYLTLKAWTDVFGYSEIALRSLSVLFGLLTVLFVYKIAKELTNHKSPVTSHYPLFAALLIATSPFHIYYSQEARMYSMAAFFAALSIYSYVLLISETKKKFFINPWIIFSLALTLLIFTDYLPVFLLPVFWLYAYLTKQKKIWWVKFLIAHIPLLILGLLWLPIFLIQSKQGNWLLTTLPAWRNIAGGATAKQAALVWIKFTLGRISLVNKIIYYFLIVISSFPFIAALLRAWIDREKTKLLWFWLFIPLLLAFAVSFWFPAFIYFRFVFVIPAFYLLVSWGINHVKTKKIKIMLISSLIIINIGGWFIYVFDSRQHREEWRGAVQFIEAKWKPLEVVIFDFPEPIAPYKWYEKGIVPAYGATDSILASVATFNKTKELVKDLEGVYYFEYLYDLTDPNRYVEKSLLDSEFIAADQFSQFSGIGSIIYYKRQ